MPCPWRVHCSVLGHMRANLFWTLVLLLSAAGVTAGQSIDVVSIAAAEGCPVRVESAQLERGSASGIRVRFVVHNPQKRAVQKLVVTAATLDRDGRVTAVRMQTTEEIIDARARREQLVVFDNLHPGPGERVVFGVQAVSLGGHKEWTGAVRLASAATLTAARD